MNSKEQEELDKSYIGKIYEANDKRFGKFKIIEFLGITSSRNRQYKIRFLNTGFESICYKNNILKGRVSDNSLTMLQIGKKYPTKKGGYVVIQEYIGLKNRHQIYKCKFLNTENEYEFRKDHILEGNIEDSILYELKPGMIYSSNNYGDFEIIEKVENYYKQNEGYKTEKFYKIRFINTKEEQICARTAILNGEIYDYKYPSIFEIGFLGGTKYNGNVNYYEFNIFKNIIERCYKKNCSSYISYGAKGVKVAKEWHNFQNFCEWYINEKQKYKNLKNLQLDLDKDLKCLQKQSKIYSKETCILLPTDINCFLAGEHKTVGITPKFINDELYFESKIRYKNKICNLGTFKSFEEAKIAYAKEKKKYWLELLEQYKNILPKEYYNLCLQYDFSWGLLKS